MTDKIIVAAISFLIGLVLLPALALVLGIIH